MKTCAMNLFIIGTRSKITGLRRDFYNWPGSNSSIDVFYTDESYPERIETNTSPFPFIIDYSLEGKNEIEILTSIQPINANADVIMRSYTQNIKVDIGSFGGRRPRHFIKHKKLRRQTPSLYSAIIEPIHIIPKEYKFEKFIVIFLITFILVGIVVLVFLKIISAE